VFWQHFQQALACSFLQVLARTRGVAAHSGSEITPEEHPKLGFQKPLLLYLFQAL
jgi:hypothetical protein